MTSYADDLALALELAELADSITTQRFEATDLEIQSKPDMTPVSDADLACEQALRAKLEEARPSDAVLGEEFGGDPRREGRQWIIDPIDGTKNYVRGVPVWATLIALVEDGRPVVGVVSAPALFRRWYASLDAGAWRTVDGKNHRRIKVSGVRTLGDASVSFSELSDWAERGLLDNFLALSEAAWRLRGYGDFFSYCLVAEGSVDVATEPEVSLWDLAALSILVTEAGGQFTSLSGEPGPYGGDAVATNGWLHADVLARLGRGRGA